MSGSVIAAPGVSTYGLLGSLVTDSNTVRQRLDTLTEQASSGNIATTYAGLGSGASVSIDLNPVVASQQTWQNGINQVTGQMQVAQTAMTQIQQVASNFYAQLNNLNGLDASDVDSVAASARDALQQVAGLLDTTDGGLYVFAGQDSANPPVPQPDNILSSGFYTQISTAVGALSTNGAAATAASTLATASSNAAGTSPFSAALSQPAAALTNLRSSVPVDAGSSVQVGLLASANANVTSTGTSTTGSYTRDLLRSLATLGSLSSSQLSDPTNFDALVQDTRTSLDGAISAMAEDVGDMGNTQTQLGDIGTQIGDAQTALKGQISDAEDVDMASTLSQLTLVQTQMQSSYQLIAGLSSMSLVKFLS